MHKLLSTTALLFGARIAGSVLAFVAQIVLARYVSPAELGLYFLSVGLVTALSVLTSLGYPNLVPRIAARYRNSPERFERFMRRVRRDCLWASVIAAVVAVPLVAMIWRPHNALVISVALLALPSLAGVRISSAIANARRKLVVTFAPELLLRPAGVLVTTLALAAFYPGFDAIEPTIAFVIVSIFVALWARTILGDEPSLHSSDMATPRLTAAWRRTAAPLVIVALFTVMFVEMSTTVAGMFLSLEELAIFAVSLKIAWLGGFAIQVVHQALLPDIADRMRLGETVALHRQIALANALNLVMAVGLCGVIYLFGDKILAVFGPEYRAGFIALNVLAFGQIVRAAGGPAVHVLTVTGRQRSLGYMSLISLVALVASMAPLGMRWGSDGAAVSVLIATIVWSAGTAILVARLDGVRCDLLGIVTTPRPRVIGTSAVLD